MLRCTSTQRWRLQRRFAAARPPRPVLARAAPHVHERVGVRVGVVRVPWTWIGVVVVRHPARRIAPQHVACSVRPHHCLLLAPRQQHLDPLRQHRAPATVARVAHRSVARERAELAAVHASARFAHRESHRGARGRYRARHTRRCGGPRGGGRACRQRKALGITRALSRRVTRGVMRGSARRAWRRIAAATVPTV